MDLRKILTQERIIEEARKNGEKNGKTAELDFGAGAEWALSFLCSSSSQLKGKKILNFEDWAETKGYTRINKLYFIKETAITHNDILHRRYKKAIKNSL